MNDMMNNSNNNFGYTQNGPPYGNNVSNMTQGPIVPNYAAAAPPTFQNIPSYVNVPYMTQGPAVAPYAQNIPYAARATYDNDNDDDDSNSNSTRKRKTGNYYYGSSNKRAKTISRIELRNEALELLTSIIRVDGVYETPVYDSCPDLVQKIEAFLLYPGMTKTYFCAALGGINSNSLNTFLSGVGQDQCGNVTYRKSWVFFEKLRIWEGEPKSAARIMNEMEMPYGFRLKKARPPRYVPWLPPDIQFLIHGRML